jgi:hypothetical protein
MKHRLTALIVLLSLALASCSLSEDITPPPGYQSPTSMPTLGPVTPAQEPSLTMEPVTATPESPSVGTIISTTPSAGISATPGAAYGNISGKLVNGSGGGIPDGQTVNLEGFDMDQSGNYQNAMQLQATVNPDGSYDFTGVEFPLNRAFLVITSWQGVEYSSDPVMVKDATTNYSIPITIYDKTGDLNSLSLDQVHLSFDLSSQNVIQVTEIFIVSNLGKQAVAVASDGSTIPFIQIPANASGVQYQLSQNSAQLMNATGGFALLPGADKQYGFIATFSMAYTGSLNFKQPFSLPVPSLTVFVPQGMSLRAEQLTSAGTQAVQGQTYMMYQANALASGSSLSLTLSGKPGTSANSTPSQQTIVLIGIGIVGLLLIVVGIYLYLRDRARLLKAEKVENDEPLEEDALGEDRDNIMDAMIALDDQYKAGEIPKEAYEKRRLELKERLRGIL